MSLGSMMVAAKVCCSWARGILTVTPAGLSGVAPMVSGNELEAGDGSEAEF